MTIGIGMISDKTRANDRNKYGGRCDRCGKRIAAGEGSFRFLKWRDLQWPHEVGRTGDVACLEHWGCREKYDGTPHHWAFPGTHRAGGNV